jgi:hypothetical protein
MTIPQIRKLCDFFAIDRTHVTAKEALIEKLMDFLGKPDESFTKSDKSSEGDKKKKKTTKKEASEDDEEEAAGDDKEEENGDAEDDKAESSPTKEKKSSKKKGPTDSALRQWVKAYTHVFPSEKQDIKHAMDLAKDKFDTDMADHKARIKELMETDKK